MEVGESILDSIDEELCLEDSDDVEMMDVEEGEIVEGPITGNIGERNEKEVKIEPYNQNPRAAQDMSKKKNGNNNNKKKKKKKKKKALPRSNGLDIDRFVLDVCKRLRERKSYLVYTAVGVLGVSALRDLVKEVDAVQACGGQKTALGDRLRTGGGILWNILKARDPNAFKEIMKKGKEFEKQFRQPGAVQQPAQKNTASESTSVSVTGKPMASPSDDDLETQVQEQSAQPNTEEKRRSVHDRIRLPVSYDDLPVEEPPTDTDHLT